MNLRYANSLWVLFLFVMASCQKSYERPDLSIGTNPGTGGGGSTGALLVRAEAKTTGNTTEAFLKTYDYDASNRIVWIKDSYTDSSNQTRTIVYRYERDAAGKVTRIVSNLFSATQPGAGFPDSIYIKVHYPAGSSDFDYTTYTVDLGGISYKDSVTFVYTNGVITTQSEYTGFVQLGGMSMMARSQYEYSNGNLTGIKSYDQSSTTVPVNVSSVAFDNNTASVSTGVESFLMGQTVGCVSKNNPVKETYTDNRSATVLATVTYSLQYNANNQPVTGTSTQTVPMVKTQALKFFYK